MPDSKRRPPAIEYTYRHRVRYRECDPMGVVYHTHYLDYFEAARTEALRDMGLAYKDLEASGIIMPVIEVAVRYHRPATYDDVLDITALISDVPSTRVHVAYEVHRAGEARLLVSGHVDLCFVDNARNRPTRAPDHVVALFEKALAP